VQPAQVLADLSASRCGIEDLAVPWTPGVYAIYLRDQSALPHITTGRDGLLYIGLSSNLAQRQFETHFQSGQSGFSTLRRTVGALLIGDLELRPRPRGLGASTTNYRNYRFDDAGEEALSTWMREHVDVAIQPVAEPDRLEHELLALACPPLNLKGWANPDAAAIKAARKACVAAARAAEPR
jgi:hypothetical protein